jgi:hypothetical protein
MRRRLGSKISTGLGSGILSLHHFEIFLNFPFPVDFILQYPYNIVLYSERASNEY